MKPFNLEEAKAGKPIVCRDGTPAKFIAHVPEGHRDYQIACLVDRRIMTFSERGFVMADGYMRSSDLFMAPEKKMFWINVYPGSTGYPSKDAADSGHASGRIACIEVTYEEGQGL